ncbi:hypothetical protein HanXRQr2_Chr14g0649001 [Helianthus annuus]|uniref:Uncharacterized protein n=1 Tax=Helianthus annuus TaxID=4232 RepID=A0A9K3H6L6_HELAN|nr:hypothetical protein HanXRQr2_Chr14g0649001 [Helianthus annuus]
MIPQVRANEWPQTLFYSKPFLSLVLSFDSHSVQEANTWKGSWSNDQVPGPIPRHSWYQMSLRVIW